MVYDNVRETTNPIDTTLEPDSDKVEAVDQGRQVDFLSNGFKIRNSNVRINGSGQTVIYMAFADTPSFAKAAQVLDLSDSTNISAFPVGTEVSTPSGGTSEVVSNDGEDLEVTYNAADPFLASESVSTSGTGSGTITAISKVNNTITLDNVDQFFVTGRYGVGSTARHGAMAVSDEASSVLEAAEDTLWQIVSSLTLRSLSTFLGPPLVLVTEATGPGVVG